MDGFRTIRTDLNRFNLAMDRRHRLRHLHHRLRRLHVGHGTDQGAAAPEPTAATIACRRARPWVVPRGAARACPAQVAYDVDFFVAVDVVRVVSRS